MADLLAFARVTFGIPPKSCGKLTHVAQPRYGE